MKEKCTESRELQIEELADIICEIDDNGYSYDQDGREITGYANSNKIASELIYKGYRKSTEVAREIFEEIMLAIEQGESNADVRIKDLAPHTRAVMTTVGKVYSGEIGKTICEVFKKYIKESANNEQRKAD